MGLITSIFRNIDAIAENFFLVRRTPAGIKFFSAITWLGEWKALVILGILIIILFWLKNKKRFIRPFLAAVIGAEISGQIIKAVLHRPRPLHGVGMENTLSFPSGHALIAAAFYGFLIYYFWQSLESRAKKYAYLIAGLIIILAIGFSRLYLGVHYFSDVIGGYILGAIWLAVGIYIHQKNSKKEEL